MSRPFLEAKAENEMFLTCANAKRLSSIYVDGELGAFNRTRVTAHLRRCEACAGYFDQLSTLRSTLRSLPAPLIPPRVTASLKVVASRERRIVNHNHGSLLGYRLERWRFRLNQMMRPMALPVTGGVLSSLVLFGTLILTMGANAPVVVAGAADEPVLSYPARIEPYLIPVELRTREVTLTMNLDGMGQLRGYAVADGKASFAGDSSRLQSTKISLPSLGQALGVARPISGDIQISFQPLGLRR
jgi:hypothetical protein